MGFRFRKSFRIFPGIRINLSKTGIGASLGFRGFRLTKRADGKVQRTISLPGTGISFVDTLGKNEKSKGTSSSRPRIAKCPSCQARYQDGVAQFCAVCGQRLMK